MDQSIVAVISPVRQIRDQIASIFEEDPRVEALWTLPDYPGQAALAQIREAHGWCIVFLDFTDPIRAKAIAADLDSYPMAATVALCLPDRPQDLAGLMQLGIREMLTLPLTAQDADRAFEGARRKINREAMPNEQNADIFAFLPARPGTGATTIAAHSAAAVSRLSGERTLLVDFDFRLGMTSFLFKLHSQHSVFDALAFGDRLNDTVWDQLIGRRDSLDILGSAPIEFDRQGPGAHPSILLDFAGPRYKTICVDLPGEMRDHELEALRRAKEIFLVSTPDVGTLHMAKRKSDMLQLLGIQPRVSVIMNRGLQRGSMAVGDIEQVLQLPVRFTLPEADKEILQATQKAVAIQGRSPIAMQFENIARRMVGDSLKPTGKGKVRSRLIDFFSVTPVREKAGRQR